MRAMILAAGRGSRMRPLTDHTPKALLEVNHKPLIVHHIENLKRSGITDIVINLAHLGGQIQQLLKDGADLGINIIYSPEIEGELETGGGIFNALPLLGPDPFLVISADIFTSFAYDTLPTKLDSLAHLVLVDNPQYHDQGDFGLVNHQVINQGNPILTFSNIVIYHPDLFKSCQAGFFPLGPLLRQGADEGFVTGEYFQGQWHNVGTPEQLSKLN